MENDILIIPTIFNLNSTLDNETEVWNTFATTLLKL